MMRVGSKFAKYCGRVRVSPASREYSSSSLASAAAAADSSLAASSSSFISKEAIATAAEKTVTYIVYGLSPYVGYTLALCLNNPEGLNELKLLEKEIRFLNNKRTMLEASRERLSQGAVEAFVNKKKSRW